MRGLSMYFSVGTLHILSLACKNWAREIQVNWQPVVYCLHWRAKPVTVKLQVGEYFQCVWCNARQFQRVTVFTPHVQKAIGLCRVSLICWWLLSGCPSVSSYFFQIVTSLASMTAVCTKRCRQVNHADGSPWTHLTGLCLGYFFLSATAYYNTIYWWSGGLA